MYNNRRHPEALEGLARRPAQHASTTLSMTSFFDLAVRSPSLFEVSDFEPIKTVVCNYSFHHTNIIPSFS